MNTATHPSSDYEEIKEDGRRMEHFMCVSHVLKDYLPKELWTKLNPFELLTIYGKVYSLIYFIYQWLGILLLPISD